MIRKQIIIIGIIALTFSAQAAWAGSAAQHRLEGVAIGIGALILAKTIIDHHQYDVGATAQPVAASAHRGPHRRPSGYWDVRKEWVPAKYKRVWNPGHHGRHGKWIPGRWKRVEVRSGFWTKRRVWISYR